MLLQLSLSLPSAFAMLDCGIFFRMKAEIHGKVYNAKVFSIFSHSFQSIAQQSSILCSINGSFCAIWKFFEQFLMLQLSLSKKKVFLLFTSGIWRMKIISMENMFVHELQIFMVEFSECNIAIIMWLLLFLKCTVEWQKFKNLEAPIKSRGLYLMHKCTHKYWNWPINDKFFIGNKFIMFHGNGNSTVLNEHRHMVVWRLIFEAWSGKREEFRII